MLYCTKCLVMATFALCLPALDLFAQTAAVPARVRTPRPNAMPQALTTNLNRTAANKLEIPIRLPEKKKAVVPDLKPEEPLINVNGTILTWGAMRRYAELLVADFKLPAGVTAADFEAERDNILMRYVFKLGASFVTKSLLAQEAVRNGITLPHGALAAKQKELAEEIRKSGTKNPAYFREIESPGSFLWYECTNSLLAARLTSEVIRPVIKVSESDVADYIKLRLKQNEDIKAYNKGLRPRIELLLKRLKAGESFSEIAAAESDCDTRLDGGEWGMRKREELRPEIADAAFNMKEGALSDIVETPYSFHILKLNKKNAGFLKEGEKGPAPIVSVSLAHIMLEKKELLPLLTPEKAREELIASRTKTAVSELKDRLLKAAKIETPLPLY